MQNVFKCSKTERLIIPPNLWYKWKEHLTSEDHDAHPYCDCPKNKCRELERERTACSKWGSPTVSME